MTLIQETSGPEWVKAVQAMVAQVIAQDSTNIDHLAHWRCGANGAVKSSDDNNYNIPALSSSSPLVKNTENQ